MQNLANHCKNAFYFTAESIRCFSIQSETGLDKGITPLLYLAN